MIPDSAIEAAHKAWREQAKQDGTIFEYNLRAAIEAAAVHVEADGWAKAYAAGFMDARDGKNYNSIDTNPYR